MRTIINPDELEYKKDLIIEIPEILNQNTIVMLSDLNGKLMIRQILPNSTRQTQLDVSILAAGSYILTIQTSNSKISKLVIKP